MRWDISKEFGFDYGHRVWSQKLNTEFSLDSRCVCRHLHGHRASVIVHLSSENLDEQGMVTDFKHLNWVKKFFDDYIDHKFILHSNDPLYGSMLHLLNELTRPSHSPPGTPLPIVPVLVPNTSFLAGYILNTSLFKNEYLEYAESFFIVDFIPTSENLSKWTYEFITAKMSKINVIVEEIEWWETPKSCSRYKGKT